MLPAGAFVGVCLAWIITRLIAKENSLNIPRLSKRNILGGWTFCGICAGIPYWHMSLPFEGLFSVFLFITVFGAIILKREK